MSKIIINGGSGGVMSDDVTVTKADIVKGKTALTADSDDEIVEGTLELTGTALPQHVLSPYTFYNTDPQNSVQGTLTIQSVVNFKAAQYSSLNIICSWALPSKGPWSGVRVMAKQVTYPANVNDGTLVYEGSATSVIKALSAGTWYLKAWNYITTSHGRIYGNFVTAYVSNQVVTGQKVFTSSGIFTVPAAVWSIDVFCVGGGGSGMAYCYTKEDTADSAPGGGGGGFTRTVKSIAVTPGQQIPVTIGVGGAKSYYEKVNLYAYYGWGNDGGTTMFGSFATAIGGSGGGKRYRSNFQSTYNNDEKTGGSGGSGGGGGWRYTVGGSDGSDATYHGSYTVQYSQYRGYGQRSQGPNSDETTTRAFRDSNGTIYSDGGSGTREYTYNKTGNGGSNAYWRRDSDEGRDGWINATDGAYGTGSGGGSSWVIHPSGAGGSGCCIIRW